MVTSLRGKSSGIIRGLSVGIMTKIITKYINDAEKLRFIGILAYPKTISEGFTNNK